MPSPEPTPSPAVPPSESSAGRSRSRRRVVTRALAGVAVLLAASCAGTAGRFRFAWLTTNDVETGRSAAYPDLVPRVYAAAPDAVFEATLRAVAAVPGAKVVGADPESGTIRVERTTRLWRFVDDATIRVEPVEADPAASDEARPPGGTRVSIRSRSRVGKGDFGQNVRTIRAIARETDRILGVARE